MLPPALYTCTLAFKRLQHATSCFSALRQCRCPRQALALAAPRGILPSPGTVPRALGNGEYPPPKPPSANAPATTQDTAATPAQLANSQHPQTMVQPLISGSRQPANPTTASRSTCGYSHAGGHGRTQACSSASASLPYTARGGPDGCVTATDPSHGPGTAHAASTTASRLRAAERRTTARLPSLISSYNPRMSSPNSRRTSSITPP